MTVAPAKSELSANVTRKLPCRRHDPCLDLHFLRLAVELRQQAIDCRNGLWNVVDDDSVGAVIRDHIATLRNEFFNRDDYVLGLGIAQETCHRDFVHSQCLGFDLCPAAIRFVLQSLHGRDAQYVSFKLARQVVVLENNIQRLVPRHVVENYGQVSVNGRIEHDVQPADLVYEPEEIL